MIFSPSAPRPLDLSLGFLADCLHRWRGARSRLATPMKMPKTVSSDRMGCSSRLFMPSWKVRRRNIFGFQLTTHPPT